MFKDWFYAAGKEGESIKHANVYYPQLTLIASLVRCKLKKISGLETITYGKSERFSRNTTVLLGKEIPEGHDLVFSSPGVEVKSWKRKKERKRHFLHLHFRWSSGRGNTRHIPTLPGWAGSAEEPGTAISAVAGSQRATHQGWVEARFCALISAYMGDTVLPVLLPAPPWLEI